MSSLPPGVEALIATPELLSDVVDGQHSFEVWFRTKCTPNIIELSSGAVEPTEAKYHCELLFRTLRDSLRVTNNHVVISTSLLANIWFVSIRLSAAVELCRRKRAKQEEKEWKRGSRARKNEDNADIVWPNDVVIFLVPQQTI